MPWSTWLDRLPSLETLNRRDVRNIASLQPGSFPLAEGHTSYVSALELYKLRHELRHQAKLKLALLRLRRELISKTHGWLLNDDGSIKCQNEPCMSIPLEIEKISQSLKISEKNSFNIEAALQAFRNRI